MENPLNSFYLSKMSTAQNSHTRKVAETELDIRLFPEKIQDKHD